MSFFILSFVTNMLDDDALYFALTRGLRLCFFPPQTYIEQWLQEDETLSEQDKGPAIQRIKRYRDMLFNKHEDGRVENNACTRPVLQKLPDDLAAMVSRWIMCIFDKTPTLIDRLYSFILRHAHETDGSLTNEAAQQFIKRLCIDFFTGLLQDIGPLGKDCELLVRLEKRHNYGDTMPTLAAERIVLDRKLEYIIFKELRYIRSLELRYDRGLPLP